MTKFDWFETIFGDARRLLDDLGEGYKGDGLLKVSDDSFFFSTAPHIDDVDVQHDASGTTILIPVAGMTREHVKLTLDSRILTVTAEADLMKRAVRWKRRFQVGLVEASDLDAEVHNGLLTIRIARSAPSSTATPIPVR